MPTRPIPSLLLLALATALGAPAHGNPPTGTHGSPAPMAAPRAATGTPASSRQVANPRPANMPKPTSNNILIPGALPRFTGNPVAADWQGRDILKEIQAMSRRGFIRVVNVDARTKSLQDCSDFPAGWKAYGFAVPGRENLHVRLHHPNEGWFRLMMVDKWGRITEGMLQNLIPTGNPEVTFKNPSQNPRVVYVIVDDPGWMSNEKNTYTLNMDRSWDPDKRPMSAVPTSYGVWAVAKPAAEPRDVKAPEQPAPAAPGKG